MKKLFISQWILLIIGISILAISEWDCEIPQKLLDKLNVYLQMKVRKLYVKSHCITLLDFNYKNFSCKRLEIRWKSLFWNVQYSVEEGRLLFHNNEFYAINGSIFSRFWEVCGFLELRSHWIKNIKIACQDFVKISEITKKFRQSSTLNLSKLESLNLKMVTDSKHLVAIYGEGRNLSVTGANIQRFYFSWPLKEKETIKLWLYGISYKQWMLSKAFLHAGINQKNNTQLDNVCFLTNLNTTIIQDLFLFLKSKRFSIRKNNFVELAGFTSDLNFTGSGKINIPNQDFKCFICKGQWLPSWDKIEKNYSIPYFIESKNALFFSLYGALNDFRTILYMRDFSINDEIFLAAQSYIHYQDQQRLLGDIKIYGAYRWLDCIIKHDFLTTKGFCRIKGCLSPELTYPWKEILPNGWQYFCENFQFYNDFPETNFAFYWNKNAHENFLYGNVFANDFKYKTSEVKHLNLVFGYQPGYRLLAIKALETKDGKGSCTIHWPYNCENECEEYWKFNGEGNFNVNTWQRIINDCVEHVYCNKIAQQFQENAPVQIDFKGMLYKESNPREYLNLIVTIPKTTLYNFPIRELNFHYYWKPQQFSIEAVKGIVEKFSPIEGYYSCQKNQFNFKLKADSLQTETLLRHPFLIEWSRAIPEKNRSTYMGKMDLLLEGTGTFEEKLQMSGKGWAHFDNPQLSQIHLLGPLRNLFSKRFKWKPTIEFDRLISDFTFTEKQIVSDNTILSGPSTRANVYGGLNLENSELNAQVHFSFLDYQQLKMPIMKELFQLFQPISKGFSASVQGTFEDPQWTLTFNPFRFVLPQKTVHKKRKN